MRLASLNGYVFCEMETLEKIITRFDPEATNLLSALRATTENFGYLSLKNAKVLADYFSLPLSQIYETASFYDLLETKKNPPLVIQVCSGGECSLEGKSWLVRDLENYFSIKAGEEGTGLVRLELISCLGRCQEGPVVVVNGTVHAGVNREKLWLILEKWLG